MMLGQVTAAEFRDELLGADLVVWDMPPASYRSARARLVAKDREKSKRRHLILTDLLEGFEIVHNSYLMDGDLGPAVVCQGSMLHYDPASANTDQVEPTADAVYAMLSLMHAGWHDLFLGSQSSFSTDYCASQRLSVPPYPYLGGGLADMARAAQIENDIEALRWFWPQDVMRSGGKWKCAGADGLLGVATGIGESMNEAWGRCYQHIRTLRVSGASLQYRKDGLKSAKHSLRHRGTTLCPGD